MRDVTTSLAPGWDRRVGEAVKLTDTSEVCPLNSRHQLGWGDPGLPNWDTKMFPGTWFPHRRGRQGPGIQSHRDLVPGAAPCTFLGLSSCSEF